jgi:radical SAM superfamily enzyme YgiQ (UPF0313 family)
MAANDVLLVACYELGHQPLSLAWPAAVLRSAGFGVTTADLAVEALPVDAARDAQLVGVAVPMHTAMRLGVQVARRIRRINPQAHIVFYGLYAWLNADYLRDEGLADSVLSGELEEGLVALAGEVLVTANCREARETAPDDGPIRQRLQLPTPDRAGLPGPDRYARFMHDGRAVPAGYVEATRGCLHTCRHCPVVPIYNGRFFVVPAESVLADIRQQVALGVEHITFGDPDFLNGPGHALAICRQLHAEFPGLTFDFTTKVEHILQHRALIPELRSLGAAFVISAFESVDELTLVRLHKGHTRQDMSDALAVLEAAGLPVQPTWLPFTPWTTLDGYLDLLAWIREHDLIANVPAVQLSIRLLVPPRSALLGEPDTADWLGDLDPPNFTYHWRNPDPSVDELQRHVARLAEGAGDDPYETFAVIEQLAYGLAGRVLPHWQSPTTQRPAPPRLTEDWFC